MSGFDFTRATRGACATIERQCWAEERYARQCAIEDFGDWREFIHWIPLHQREGTRESCWARLRSLLDSTPEAIA